MERENFQSNENLPFADADIRLVKGEEEIERLLGATLSQVQKRICICGDQNVPTILTKVAWYRAILYDLKQRRVRIQLATDIGKGEHFALQEDNGRFWC